MKGRRKYNLVFPEDWTDLSIELRMYADQDLPRQYGGQVLGKAFHLRRALKLLYDDTQLVWHKWLDEHIEIWCDDAGENNGFSTIFGCGAGGKSNDFGVIALADWYADPKNTCTLVCSTTKDMLEKRIWEAVMRYFNYHLRDMPGKLSKRRTAIITEGDDDDEVESGVGMYKAGIYGIAVQQGSQEQALNNIIGVHLPHVRIIIDEAQQTREAAFNSRHNLKLGTPDFKLVAMGNPPNWLNPLGRHSIPLEGIKSINPDVDRKWKTAYGMCYYFDSQRSPAVTEPEGEKKFPFLVNAEQRQEAATEDAALGTNTVAYWQFIRGFPAPEGIINAVLSEPFLIQFDMMEKTRWEYDYITVAGLDPSFTYGGDKCVLRFADVGVDIEGNVVIQFHPAVYIPLVTLPDRALTFNAADQVIARCKERGVPKRLLGTDDTATQSMADIIDETWVKGKSKNEHVHRIVFGGAASEMTVSMKDTRLAKDVYRNRVTELWFNMREFGKHNQIRNLDEKTATQYTTRLVIPGRVVQVEPKPDMKDRGLNSPDEGDSCAVVLAVVREVLRFHPGSTKLNPKSGRSRKSRPGKNTYSHDNAYQESQFAGMGTQYQDHSYERREP